MIRRCNYCGGTYGDHVHICPPGTRVKLNGCHNHPPYKDFYGSYGLDSNTGEIKFFSIPNPNTKECQYQHTQLGKADQGCNGCKWRNE